MIHVFCKKGMLGEEVSRKDIALSWETGEPGCGQVITRKITPRDLRADFVDKLPHDMLIDIGVDGKLLQEDDPAMDLPLVDEQQVIIYPRQTYDVLVFVGYAIVYALISYGVAQLINYLWPSGKPDGITQERGDDSSQTYAWDGTKTNYGPGLPIPWLYGRHLVGGQCIFTDSQFGLGPFGGSSGDSLAIVLSLCEGPVHKIGGLSGSFDQLGILPSFPFPTPQVPLPVGITINGNLVEPNAAGIGAAIRPGTQDQAALAAPFTGVRQAFTVGEELADINSEFVFTFIDTAAISALQLVFVMPIGAYVQNASGVQIGIQTSVEISWRPQGSTSWNVLTSQFNVSSATIPRFSLFGVTYFSWPTGPGIPAGTVGPIEVKVRRTTANAGTSGVAQLVWRDIVIHSPHTLRYPLEALLALQVLAGSRFSGGLPQVGTPVEGALVRVWDATNGWSPRCWDVPAAPFNFQNHAPGRNPAWCLLDYLLGRWGLGNYLTEANIDLPAFRRWAAFCDSDPDPITPWGEPAFCIDLVGDQPRSHWDWVMTFCQAGRAAPTIRDGKISVVYHYRDAHGDAGISVPAKTPTQLLNAGNVEKVQVKWTSQAGRTTVYQFQFWDEEKNWQQDVFPVEDAASTLNDPSALHQETYKPEGIDARGVTRKSQLFREGTWRHRMTRQVKRELTFVTGPWALAAEVGDLFDFQSEGMRPFGSDVPKAMQVLVVTDPTHITIDHALTGSGLQIVIRDPDGKPKYSNITSYVNTGNTSALLLATSTTPINPGATCVVGKTTKLVETYCIVAISLQSDLKREVQAIQWTPDAFDPVTKAEFEEGGEDGEDAPVEPPALSEAPAAVLGVGVAIKPNGVNLISWARAPGTEGTLARVYIRREATIDEWQLLGETEGNEMLTPTLVPGESYVASVCLTNARGDVVGPENGNTHTFLAREPEAVGPNAMLLSVFGKSASAGVTSLSLTPDSEPMVNGAPGIPITGRMLVTRLAASFKANSVPAGNWTATLERRPLGGIFTAVATAPVKVTP